MIKHTPGPWRIAADMHGIGNTPVHGIEAADGKPVANCGDWKDAEANARRIVACVNACDGIETSVLEQHALGVIAAEHSPETREVFDRHIKLIPIRQLFDELGNQVCSTPEESCHFLVPSIVENYGTSCNHCQRGIPNNKPHRLCPVWFQS